MSHAHPCRIAYPKSPHSPAATDSLPTRSTDSQDPAAPEAQASAASASTKKNRLDSTTETSEPLDSAPTSADAGGEMDQDAPVSASASMSRSSSGESSARSERSAKSSSSKSSKSGKSNSKDKDKSKSKKGKSKSRSGEPREGDEIKAQDGKPGREGKKVKDVRHKVERLSHNGEAVSASTAEVEGQELEKEKNGAAPSPVASAMDVESAQPTEQPLHARVDTADKVMESTPMDKSTSSGGSRSKRKAMDRSASSFAGGEDEGEEAKRVKDDDSAVAAAEKVSLSCIYVRHGPIRFCCRGTALYWRGSLLRFLKTLRGMWLPEPRLAFRQHHLRPPNPPPVLPPAFLDSSPLHNQTNTRHRTVHKS